jgi:thymidine phosphorylase
VTAQAAKPPFHMVDLISAKRDGGLLGPAEIDWLIGAYTDGQIPDEQMSALLMAIVWRGLSGPELTRWTDAMVGSGSRLDLSGVGRPTVDKHSTGGVGDGVSLPLVAIVAACGAAVPQVSGRGLGHTGGTLDKMEAIPGWRATLSTEQLRAILREVGGVICAAGADLAPADRKLYALRDVTGTVESIPLIASSIMSKKIAEGTSALVLDVKVGSGTFMPDEASARLLAETMVGLGQAAGVSTSALLTDMNTPLGWVAGNALEVEQAVALLQGDSTADDLRELTLALAREMVAAAGLDTDPEQVLADGRAYTSWRAMVAAQGGDPDAALPQAAHVELIRAERSGTVTRLEARAIGVAAWRLGAGRSRKEDPVSPGAGVRWRVRVGSEVRAGDVVLELHTDEPDRLGGARTALEGVLQISDPAGGPVRSAEPAGSVGVRRLILGSVTS